MHHYLAFFQSANQMGSLLRALVVVGSQIIATKRNTAANVHKQLPWIFALLAFAFAGPAYAGNAIYNLYCPICGNIPTLYDSLSSANKAAEQGVNDNASESIKPITFDSPLIFSTTTNYSGGVNNYWRETATLATGQKTSYFYVLEVVCGPGYTSNGRQCVTDLPTKQSCSKEPRGKPCDPATGNEHYTETDYTASGAFALSFTRTYNSRLTGSGRLGYNWISNYGDPARAHTLSVNAQVTPNFARVPRPDGRELVFKKINGVWTPDADITDSLAQTENGWVYTQRDGTVETYDNTITDKGNSTGRLLSITNAAGLTQTLTYDPGTGFLSAVTDPFGHSLSFTYDTKDRLSTMTDPNGGVTTYTYDDTNNVGTLSTVTYPDGTAKSYKYNEAGYVATNLPYALTGIYDENGNRYASLSYDGGGRLSINQLADTGNGGPQKKYTFTYSGNQTTVTDAAGVKEVMTFATNLGVKNLTSLKHLSDNKTRYQTWDARNNLTCRQDEEGRVTTWTYNTANQKTSETTGRTGTCSASVNTAATRTTTYQYLSATLDLPSVIESPSVASGQVKRTAISYSGNLPHQITQSGFTPAGSAVSRTVTMGYNSFGQVTSIDGPRTDVADVTSLTYYNCTTGGACGQLQSTTNALGHSTTYDQYDAAGRLTRMTDPNGIVTTYQYDTRGRVRFVNRGGRVTEYRYDLAGNLSYVAFPDGRTLTYTYDAAKLLRTVTDNTGNRIEYGYDLKGNRVSEKTFDTSGTLARSVESAYDARNRVSQINAGDSITKQIFDAVGNLTRVTDPNTVAANGTAATVNQYDALSRLFKTVDLLNGNTLYGYDVNDRLQSVQAPNGATTAYEYDDLGNLLRETSPDRGLTSYTHDSAGNVRTVTDARGITATYSYDALNRVVAVDYPGTDEDIAYTHDSGTGCTYGLGRLCQVTDASGSTQYAYDAFGNITTHTHTELSATYITRYSYDAGNRVTSITYPNSRVVSYGRDALGRIATATMALNGVNTTLVTAAGYRPDGLVASLAFGNGLTDTRLYDTQGRLREQYLGNADTRLYAYDANGNLTGLQSLPQVGAYTYDPLNRLSRDQITSPPTGDTTFTYDANGNRLSENTGSYAYLAGSNRLTSAPGNSISLDAAGNTLSDGIRSYSYNNAGHLSQVTGVASYVYNAQRQRTRKTAGSESTVYHYDLAGNLLAETRADGTLIRDYVWVDSTPVVKIETGENIAYLHTDHLNTPRLATDTQGAVVWRWEGKAFGDSQPTGSIAMNLRFPGQYYDAETGLHYNWNRYYDPKLGRYITSDPIGLEGGLNTYAYVKDNPLRWFDPTGLASCNGQWIKVRWVRDPFSPITLNCTCYWSCYSCPPGSDVFPDPNLGQFSTKGKIIFSGKPGGDADPEGGDACLCDKPGSEKGCKPCQNQ